MDAPAVVAAAEQPAAVVVAAPASPAEPKSSAPLQTFPTFSNEPKTALDRLAGGPSRVAIALLVAVSAIALMALAPLLVGRLHSWWQVGGGVPPVVYALAHIIPTEPCLPVNIDEMKQNGTALFGTVDLRNVRASLYHHLQYSRADRPRPQGISAQYLERHQICFALINLTHSHDDATNLVEMINMRIVGVSIDMRLRTRETSSLCEHAYSARRFQDVTIVYWTPEGVRRMLNVEGLAAITVQQVDDIQTGSGYCQDTNLEAQIERLQRRVTTMDQRTAGSVGTVPLQLPH
jgi:hypothetical protein